MRVRITKHAASLLLILSLGMTSLASAPARADNETMMKLLEVLHDNGTINDEAYHMLLEAARSESSSEPSAATAEQAPAESEPAAPATTVTLDEGGLDIRSPDNDARLRLGGRLHLDSARYNEDEIPLGNGSTVRRLRLEARAEVAENWEAKASIDFADNEVDLKSTYLEYTALEDTPIIIGHYKEPFSLEELSSSNDTVLMERAMMTGFAPGRHFGLGASRLGDSSMLTAGLFGGTISDETENDSGWGMAARGTWFPVLADDRVIHLGTALNYRETGDDDVFRLRARPESSVTDVRLVDTGDIPGVADITSLGLEAAGIYGPLTLQGEYIASSLGRDAGMPDLDFSGWYVLGSWLLTGESRRYKPGSGEMGGVVPRRNFGAGGIGAWELAARYSTIDLTDDAVIGGVQDNLTLGLNWYASPNVRFMLNYVDVLDVDRPGTAEDGEDPDIIQIRAQFNY